jgi:hypothetical protein
MDLISFWLAINQHSLLWTALGKTHEFSKNLLVELNSNIILIKALDDTQLY